MHLGQIGVGRTIVVLVGVVEVHTTYILDELCMGTYLSYRSGVPDTFQSCKFHQFSSPYDSYKMFSEKSPNVFVIKGPKSPCCYSPKSLYVQKRSRIYVGYRENTVPTETQTIISAAYAGLNKVSRQLLLHCFHGAQNLELESSYCCSTATVPLPLCIPRSVLSPSPLGALPLKPPRPLPLPRTSRFAGGGTLE